MDEILEYLNGINGAEEASEVRTFDLYISGFGVRVEVHDHGERADSLRWQVQAFSPDIPEQERGVNAHGSSSGNPDPTLRGALMEVHWNVFTNRTE